MPGGIERRAALACIYVLPKVLWAAPFVATPPASVSRDVMDAVLCAHCTWWCRARFFADRVNLHPGLTLAVRSLSTAHRFGVPPSPFLVRCVETHAATLHVQPVSFQATGLRLRVLPSASPQVRALLGVAAGGDDSSFNAATPAGQHLLRVSARACALASFHPQRRDSEGLEHVDIGLLSAPSWKRFLASLPPDDAALLRVWRGGAVRTPTRRWFRRNHSEALSVCVFCAAPRASARHLFVECPHSASMRVSLESRYGLVSEWWSQQPRCTTKSGWVVLDAAPSLQERVRCCCAASLLGIAIARAGQRVLSSSAAAALEDGDVGG